MFTRSINDNILRLSKIYKVVSITGPRQSGKTTISKILFPHLPYVSFENLDVRTIAKDDPRGFLQKYLEGSIFDEIQHVPEIFSYLQEIVDSSNENGRFIITGSQNFILNHHISQLLAGRVCINTLLPMSLDELDNYDAMSNIFNGGYPRLHQLNIAPIDFYPSYIQTYLEKDVRQIQNIGDLTRFKTFLKLCAGRIGQLVNLSSLAIDAGVSHTTVRTWLSILEASYVIFFLPPFYNNFNKRLIKSPKLYFYDTGVACSLLGLENQDQVETHYLKGGLYENLVILEFIKYKLNKGMQPNIYFWRDRTGNEIDLIIERGDKISAFEIKSSSTFNVGYAKTLEYFLKIAKVDMSIIYNGPNSSSYKQINIIPISQIKQFLI